MSATLDIFECARGGDNVALIRFIDKLGGDPNTAELHGFTCLHIAAKQGHLATVEVLLSRGANGNKKNDGGNTALHDAVAHHRLAVVERLLNAKADPNAANKAGNTPLHYATFWRYMEIAEKLVSAGAEISIPNNSGQLALDRLKPEEAKVLRTKAEEFQKTGKKMSIVAYQEPAQKVSKSNSKEFQRKNKLAPPVRFLNVESSANVLIPNADAAIAVPFGFIDVQDCIGNDTDGDVFRGTWRGPGSCMGAKIEVKMFLKDVWSSAELQKLRNYAESIRANTQCMYLRSILAVCVQPPNVCVVSNKTVSGPLRQHIEQAGRALNDMDQLSILVDVARGLTWLHDLVEPLAPLYNVTTLSLQVNENGVIQIPADSFQFPHDFGHLVSLFHPEFAAPEVLLEREGSYHTKPVDVYAFAMVMYEVVTHKRPFGDQHPMVVGMNVAMHDNRPDLPAALRKYYKRLIEMCWVRNPRERPSMVRVLTTVEKMKEEMAKMMSSDSDVAQQPEIRITNLADFDALFADFEFGMLDNDTDDLMPWKA